MRRSIALLALLSLCSVGAVCSSQLVYVSVFPDDGLVITTQGFDVDIRLGTLADAGTLTATLNGVAVPLAGGPTIFTASYTPGAPLLDENTLIVSVKTTSGVTTKRTHVFSWLPPKARAFEITNAGDLIAGPLAQNRIGDYMLENDIARYAIQDVAQRDLHSVGQFGGNLIDAELVAKPGRDQFFEIQPAINIETVANFQTVIIVNDGQDGTTAILRVCGPDDLIDYINASSQVASLGAAIPFSVDDKDYDVDACTEYRLEPDSATVEVDTTIFNNDPAPVGFYPGYYINGMGALEQWVDTFGNPDAGMGEPLVTGSAFSLSYAGFGDAEGVDYAIAPDFEAIMGTPNTGSSTFTSVGVTYLLYNQGIINVLVGAAPQFEVPGSGSKTFGSLFAVGNGSAGNGVKLDAEVFGLATGTVAGCVTANGSPVPRARIALGSESGGLIDNLGGHFVADAAGCYSGELFPGSYQAAAGKEGYPYEGGGAAPTLHTVVITANTTTNLNIAIPETGELVVNALDGSSSALPTRVTVVGFDPSPDLNILTTFGIIGDISTWTFNDRSREKLPDGVAALSYTDASGSTTFDLEPGSYQVYVSRGTEYSLYSEAVTISAGATKTVNAQIARVLDTAGQISSDYHVHMLFSPDSRISLPRRALSFAGEGVDNLIGTDHDSVTDMNPTIASLGLGSFMTSTIGEEITTFDTGHFNAYPQGQDTSKNSFGSTDWGGPAPVGEDFPSFGNWNPTPAQVEALALGKAQNAGLTTAVQINHIDSHFGPLEIDTGVTPPASFLADPAFFRLDPTTPNFFNEFDALELWNGANTNAQNQFLDERMGIWMNLLNQGIATAAIADTDSHTILDLETAGARTWTPSSTDDPSLIDPNEVGQAILDQRAVGGQGIYVQTRLVEGPAIADFSLGGTNLVTATDGSVDLEISVQAPTWAPYDTIEIYRNATTAVAGTTNGTPTLYTAAPTTVLTAPTNFTVSTVNVVPAVAGASRLESDFTVNLTGLTADEWIVVIVKGTSGVSAPMFPVYPRDTDLAANPTLADLVNVGVSEAGVRALGFTNALYVDVDGNGSFDAPGVSIAP